MNAPEGSIKIFFIEALIREIDLGAIPRNLNTRCGAQRRRGKTDLIRKSEGRKVLNGLQVAGCSRI